MTIIRALRFIFNLLYRQFAWTYDWVAAVVSAGNWITWVRSVAEHLVGRRRILEIGHGPGHLVKILAEAGHQVVAIDLSRQMGQRARKMLTKSGFSPDLVRADARRLPFADSSFDAVVATFPAEYIAEPETWFSFRRMLAGNGKIVVLLGARPGGLHPFSLFSRLLFWITGQAGETQIKAARTRFAAHFDEIGLDWSYHTGAVGKTETYYMIASPSTSDAR